MLLGKQATAHFALETSFVGRYMHAGDVVAQTHVVLEAFVARRASEKIDENKLVV